MSLHMCEKTTVRVRVLKEGGKKFVSSICCFFIFNIFPLNIFTMSDNSRISSVATSVIGTTECPLSDLLVSPILIDQLEDT